MANHFPLRINHILATVMALLLSACGGSSSDGGSGVLSLNITDAPVVDEDIAEVWVRFTQVIIHPAGGDPDIVVDVVNENGDPWRDMELTSLVEGKTMLLGEVELKADDYSWIRLVIDPDNTRIVERTVVGEPDGEGNAENDDMIYPPKLLDCSSCDESHLKLNRHFTVENEGWINFTIDFELPKSLTLQLPQSEKPRPDYAYKLRPTLRILDTELASTFIWGSVTDMRAPPTADPADPTGCKVYTYTGDMATVVPDDICTGVCVPDVLSNQRPLDIASVNADLVNNDGSFDYRTGSLYPGTYTLAMICEPDDPDMDETLAFIGEQDVDATMEPPSPLGVGPVDFVLED
jgi:hypothetical protein